MVQTFNDSLAILLVDWVNY